MIVALVAVLLAQSTPVSTVFKSEPTGSVQIPDEIAPAVIPYVLCLSDRSNAAIRAIPDQDKIGGFDDAHARAINTAASTECRTVRETATVNARKMLGTRGTGGAGTQAKMIEDTLLAIEATSAIKADKDTSNKAPTAPGN